MSAYVYARVDRWPSAREWPDDTSRVLLRVEPDGYHVAVDGDPSAPFCVPPQDAHFVHPLVVLDPENDDDVAGLLAVMEQRGWYGLDEDAPGDMKAALRALADPPARKPAEPTGLGAVVRDRRGDAWVNVEPHRWRHVTTGCDWPWVDVHARVVLSEGWTDGDA